MAALGCSTATTQMGQLCGAKYNVRVAGFQTITHSQAVNGRSQSCTVAEMGSRAAMTREGRHRADNYNSAWGRGTNTIISGRMPSSGPSQPRGLLGSFLQIFRTPANAFDNFGNSFGEPDVRVDNRPKEPAREAEWLDSSEVEDNQSLNVVEVKKSAQNTKALESAVGEGSSVAKSATGTVGDALRTTGLEINLDVGLKELTIKELVLKDLGLVLAVKKKPQAESPDGVKKMHIMKKWKSLSNHNKIHYKKGFTNL